MIHFSWMRTKVSKKLLTSSRLGKQKGIKASFNHPSSRGEEKAALKTSLRGEEKAAFKN